MVMSNLPEKSLVYKANRPRGSGVLVLGGKGQNGEYSTCHVRPVDEETELKSINRLYGVLFVQVLLTMRKISFTQQFNP